MDKKIIDTLGITKTTPTLDMTPDKTIMIKLGQKNYRLPEALAELIDNCIDAKLVGIKLLINLIIDLDQENPEKSEIIISDNASGMNEETFKDSAILGKSSKLKALGIYGLGLKTACMNIAKNYEVVTGEIDSTESYSFLFDEDEWLTNELLTWSNYPYGKYPKKKEEHYTKIRLTKLKITHNQKPRRTISRIMEDFSLRYGNLIEKGDMEIIINGERIEADFPRCEESTKINFSFYIDPKDQDSKVTGWIGLRWNPLTGKVEGSQTGKYGFMTYRNNRRITEWDDMKVDKDIFAIRRHPTWATIIGVVNLDCVPVEIDKRNFIQEHPMYIEAVKKIRPYVKKIEGVIKGREHKSEIAEDIKELTEEIVSAVEEALTGEDIKELVQKNSEDDGETYKKVIKKSISGKLVRGDEIVEGDKEVRKKSDKVKIGTVKPSPEPVVRIPEKSKPGEIKDIEVQPLPEGVRGSQTIDIEVEDDEIQVTHLYVDHIEGEALRAWECNDKDELIIKTNIGPIFDMTGKEYPTFALHNVCESLSEFILETEDINKRIEMRDMLIKKSYKIISRLGPIK